MLFDFFGRNRDIAEQDAYEDLLDGSPDGIGIFDGITDDDDDDF